MQIKCLAQGHNILMSGFEPSTSVSRNQHSNYMTNMLHGHVGMHIGGFDGDYGGYGVGQRNLEGGMLLEFCLEE